MYFNHHIVSMFCIRLTLDFALLIFYARELAIARISYGNSVCLSLCPGVTSRFHFKTRWDRDFRFSPYDSL